MSCSLIMRTGIAPPWVEASAGSGSMGVFVLFIFFRMTSMPSRSHAVG